MKKNLLFLSALLTASSLLLAQSWSTVTPPTTGTATAITVHNNALFITTTAASPHQSTDGTNWVQKPNTLTAVSPQGGGIGSAGSWLYYGSKDDVYRSNDDGTTWTAVGTGITVSAFNFPRYFYEFNGVYYLSMTGAASSGGGLFRSTDGTTWTSATLGGQNGEAAYQMAEIGGKLYVGTNMSFYESSDNGVSWTSVSTSGAMVYRGLIEHLGRRLIFTTFGIEFSDDNGTSWDTLTNVLKSGTTCGFLVGANDTLYAYTNATGGGIFYSVDTGATWVDITGDLTSNDITFMQGAEYFNGNLYVATLLAVKSNGSGATSIHEVGSDENTVLAYPNPFGNVLNVKNTKERSIHIELIDVTGKLILNKRSDNNVMQIETQNLKQGIYFLKVFDNINGELISTQKIVH